MSKLKVNELDTKTGTTITVTAGKTLAGTSIIGSTQIAPDAVTYDKIQDTTTANRVIGAASAGTVSEVEVATDMLANNAVTAAKISGASAAPAGYLLRQDGTWIPAPETDTSGLEGDIALLAFKTQANGNLARYNLIDQSVDSFEDASGVDASASTDEIRDSAGKYYSGSSAIAISAFTQGTHTYTPTTTGTAEILVVAGGGGGGGAQSQPAGNLPGGGGGGGVIHATAYPIVANVVYDLTVGDGGAGSNTNTNTNGENSTFNNNNEGGQSTMTAFGGGHGGQNNEAAQAGGSCGGGGNNTSQPEVASTQTSNGGGTGYGFPADNAGGGSGAGAKATFNGGVGKEFSTFGAWGTNSGNDSGATPGSGSGKGWFAGGGGRANGGTGGAGGGGDPPTSPNQNPAQPAYDDTGGGGAAGWSEQGTPGGSGIVLILPPPAYNNMTLVSNSQTAATQPDSADVVLAYTDGTGTATINTDLIVSVSRDNGTTYTAVTLVSQGSSGGQFIVTANNVDISGQPAGTAMIWKVATVNQSASKGTRINAVSLGWS